MTAAPRGRRAARASWVVGVDIGGTFTDIVVSRGKGRPVAVGKVLTDYRDLARGVVEGVGRVLADNRIAPADVTRVVHGTTLVTNCLIERRGAKTALLVTRGFGDLLEMGRESRYDIYDIDIELPAPLVPRERVHEIGERVDHTGAEIAPLDEEDVARAVASMRDAGVESIAVCLLHAWANPTHERRIGRLLGEAMPDAAVSLSSEVMPDLREYERASTTVANAYVAPVVAGYLSRLEAALAGLGVRARLSIIASDGAVVDAATAARLPVRLTESGPAGGAIAAGVLARAGAGRGVMAYDMGGTTAKICLLDGGRPLKSDRFEFGRVHRFARGSGLPLQIPVIEMIEIGAGGGSIARTNELEMLQVGPDSANAAPGPACYGIGGTHPTVTDADLVLGYIGADAFLGGTMHLDVERARRALEREVARPLGIAVDAAAWGVHRVVNANMARAAKVHCFEHGRDPRAYTLFAYGGAGPIHAYGVAEILGVPEVVYPLRAGVMSALGFLLAEPAFEVVRGRIEALETVAPSSLDELLAAMQAEAEAIVRSSAPGAARLRVAREVALRYRGQSHELYVPLAPGRITRASLARAGTAFVAAYGARYQALAGAGGLEAVRWRVRVSAPADQGVPDLGAPRAGRAARGALRARRPAWVPEAGGYVDCPVYDRYRLAPGARFPGPAIVEEAESTVFVGRRARVTVAADGSLRVGLGPAGKSRSSR